MFSLIFVSLFKNVFHFFTKVLIAIICEKLILKWSISMDAIVVATVIALAIEVLIYFKNRKDDSAASND